MENGKQSKRVYTGKRVLRKILHSIARHSLIPSRLRVILLVFSGVKLRLPETVFIGADVYFDDTNPNLISIGKFVRITAGTKIITHFFDASHHGTEENPFLYFDGTVEISDYVFIGMGCVIAKSVKIGPWAIIGANTVVTRDVPAGAIFAGNPGKIIGYRRGFDSDMNASLREIEG